MTRTVNSLPEPTLSSTSIKETSPPTQTTTVSMPTPRTSSLETILLPEPRLPRTKERMPLDLPSLEFELLPLIPTTSSPPTSLEMETTTISMERRGSSCRVWRRGRRRRFMELERED